MKKSLVILLLVFSLSSYAEVVTLRSGQILRGQILMQTNEVVILQTPSGARFQYPMTEILQIMPDTEPPTAATAEETMDVDTHPVAIRLMVTGGVAYTSFQKVGGGLCADFQIGTDNLAGKHIFLGGSIGYAGAYVADKHHFIPLQMVVSVPLLSALRPSQSSIPHQPEIGASIGYGFAPKGHKGGLAAGLQLLYRYQFKSHSALLLGWDVRFQQGDKRFSETINGETFSYDSPGVYILTGLRLALQF